jgi:hypothetical protein
MNTWQVAQGGGTGDLEPGGRGGGGVLERLRESPGATEASVGDLDPPGVPDGRNTGCLSSHPTRRSLKAMLAGQQVGGRHGDATIDQKPDPAVQGPNDSGRNRH